MLINLTVITLILFSLLISLVSVKLLIKLSLNYNILIDNPNARKIHTESTPLIGGLGIYLSFILTFYISSLFYDIPNILIIVLTSTIVMVFGLLDDILELNEYLKLFVQIILGALIFTFGIQVNTPFAFLSLLLNILWIAGVMNSYNLIDGMDGLAGLISVFSILGFLFIGLLFNNQLLFLLSIILIGSILGFLKYNLHPAKTFMGDTGSMLVGYIIALMSIIMMNDYANLLSWGVPIMMLGVPVFDSSLTLLRRYKSGVPLFPADKNHFYNVLNRQGLSTNETVIECVKLQILFVICATILYSLNIYIQILGFILFFSFLIYYTQKNDLLVIENKE